MHVRKVAVVYFYLVAIFVSIVLAGKESNKRMPGNHAFQQMVRYGRSSNKDGKIKVYPRADVFYLGPRYGKRSKPMPTHLETLNNIQTFVNDKHLSCTYTDVSNLYRCIDSRRTTVKQSRM